MGLTAIIGRRSWALAGAVGVLLVPATAQAAPPPNDNALTPTDLVITNLNGVRSAGFDAALALPVFGIDTAEASSSPDDPVLRNDADQSSCNDAPVAGTDTVFYRLRSGSSSSDLTERTAVTIDTAGTTYANAIAVYRGGIGQSSMIRCERGNLGNGDSTVDLVTEAGVPYFVEVAAIGGQGTLNLFVRAHDVQPPTISVTAPQLLAEPNRVSTFRLVASDGAGLALDRQPEWTISFTPDGQSTDLALPATILPGGNDVQVRWPRSVSGRGTARVRVWDATGNVASASLSLRVRDRHAPTIMEHRVGRNFAKRRVAFYVKCSESGWAVLSISNARYRKTQEIRVRAKRRSSVFFRSVPQNAYVATYQCRDLANNRSERESAAFLFGF